MRAAVSAARQAQASGEFLRAREIIGAELGPALSLLVRAQDASAAWLCAELGGLAYAVGDLGSAWKLQSAVRQWREEFLPPDDSDLQLARAVLAVTMLELGDFAGARSLFERALAAYERTRPAEHLDVLRTRGNLAVTLQRLGDHAGASRLLEANLAVLERTLPADHLELQKARGNLAQVRKGLSDLEGAEQLEEQALEVLERTLPPDDLDLQTLRGNLARTKAARGDLHGARTLQVQVLEVLSRKLPADHASLQIARGNLAGTMSALGLHEEARVLEEQVLDAFERTLPADHPYVQVARWSLASTLHQLGHYADSRALWEQVVEASERTLPADHPSLLEARRGLATSLHSLGDLGGARSLLERMLEACERTLASDHATLLGARIQLAELLHDLGDRAGARVLQERVLEVCERTLPADHPTLRNARGNLASMMHGLGDLVGARELQEQVLETAERMLPADGLDLQIARSNLAMTMHMQGDIDEARALREQVLEVLERTLPPDHPVLQAARGNLALTMIRAEDYERARALEEQVLEVRERTLPDDHRDLQKARGNLAVTLAQELARARAGLPGAAGEAEEQVRERCAELVQAIALAETRTAWLAIQVGSAREAEERCSALEGELGLVLSFALGCGAFEPTEALQGAAFAFCESARAAGLGAARTSRAAGSSEEHARLAAELREASRALAELVQRGATRDEFHAARERRERLTRELTRVTAELGGPIATRPDQLLGEFFERLDAGKALVGFRRYERLSFEIGVLADEAGAAPRAPRSTESMLAFVLGRRAQGEAPELSLVDLGPVAGLEGAVRAWRLAIGAGEVGSSRGVAVTDARGIGTSVEAEAAARQSGRDLRRLVWDPLRAALGDLRHVVLVPDDVLHLVPFDALPTDEEELLGDRWRIETRSTLRELLEAAPFAVGEDGLLALGGASFDEDPGVWVDDSEDGLEPAGPRVAAIQQGVAGLLRGSGFTAGFAPLEHTGPEVLEIAALHAQPGRARARRIVVEGRQASRATLEAAAPRARWLHVATHGWFAPESVRSWEDARAEGPGGGARNGTRADDELRGMSPMLLCGLALAGANLPPGPLGRVSGLLTAEELATFDLTNCELAVLSACDTNVGERRAGQGVASLQKALHMAGAQSAITSLWKVPDEATRELMLDFYRRLWVEKKPKHQALWEAKKRLREATDERGLPLHTTRDWAAWVLTGEPD